jgi:hypothetical protein
MLRSFNFAHDRPPRQPLAPSLSRGQHERNYFKSRSVRSFGKLGGDLSAPTIEKILSKNLERLDHFNAHRKRTESVVLGNS